MNETSAAVNQDNRFLFKIWIVHSFFHSSGNMGNAWKKEIKAKSQTLGEHPACCCCLIKVLVVEMILGLILEDMSCLERWFSNKNTVELTIV